MNRQQNSHTNTATRRPRRSGVAPEQEPLNGRHAFRTCRRWIGSAVLVALWGCGSGVDSDQAGNPDLDGSFQSSSQPLGKAIAGVEPVYRFAKISNGAYFYTGDRAEREVILERYPDMRDEGIAFQRAIGTPSVPVYRFANLRTGGYFYTADPGERDVVIRDYPFFRFEGTSFSVVSRDTPGSQAVYRLANLRNGGYLYTTNPVERDVAIGIGTWRDEGVAFYAPTALSIGPRTIVNPSIRSNDGATGGGVFVLRRADGSMYACGAPNRSSLVQADTTSSLAPLLPTYSFPVGVRLHRLAQPAATPISKVVSTNLGFYALDTTGRVWGWGSNTSRKLTDQNVSETAVPTIVSGDVRDIIDIAAGVNHVLFLTRYGEVFSRGTNSFGARGAAQSVSLPTISQVPGLQRIIAIAAGLDASAAVDLDGRVWTWGRNTDGQLGRSTGSITSDPTPTVVSLPEAVRTVVAGGSTVFAITGNPALSLPDPRSGSPGRIFAWGSNYWGNLADPTVPVNLVSGGSVGLLPRQIRGRTGSLVEVRALVSADEFSVGLTASGLLAWGYGGSSVLYDFPDLIANASPGTLGTILPQPMSSRAIPTDVVAAGGLGLIFRSGSSAHIKGNAGWVEPCLNRRLGISSTRGDYVWDHVLPGFSF